MNTVYVKGYMNAIKKTITDHHRIDDFIKSFMRFSNIWYLGKAK